MGWGEGVNTIRTDVSKTSRRNSEPIVAEDLVVRADIKKWTRGRSSGNGASRGNHLGAVGDYDLSAIARNTDASRARGNGRTNYVDRRPAGLTRDTIDEARSVFRKGQHWLL